jgi:hypothetical protein
LKAQQADWITRRWYSLAIAVINYSPLMNRALTEPNALKAFITICSTRWVAIMLAFITWRVRVSWAPSVSFCAVFISALSAVNASKKYELNQHGNLYVQYITDILNAGIARLCSVASASAASFGPSFLPPFGAGAGANVHCDGVRASPHQTVLIVWLVSHLFAFWCGFLMTLRDEMCERQLFLVETGRGFHHMRPRSAEPQMLQMLGVQLYVFTLLVLNV